MNKIKVDDVMTHLVVTLRSEDTIEDAGRMLARNRISGAPVVQEGKIVDVASRADLVRAFAPPHGGFPFEAIDPLTFQLRELQSCFVRGSRVGDVMSREVVSISRDASVWEAGFASRSAWVQPTSGSRQRWSPVAGHLAPGTTR
jgi:CBS domain-containing protein